jgi:hypothetical protein
LKDLEHASFKPLRELKCFAVKDDNLSIFPLFCAIKLVNGQTVIWLAYKAIRLENSSLVAYCGNRNPNHLKIEEEMLDLNQQIWKVSRNKILSYILQQNE